MTTAIAVTSDSLAVLPAESRDAAVTQYLASARDWLARAVQETGPEQIAAVKAEVATAAEATRQLNLSKEIQEDAQEMVRRAEYALGKAIRKGQEEGTIRTRGEHEFRGNQHTSAGEVQNPDNSTKARPTDFASMNELSGDSGNGIYALADDVSDDEFDAALTEARDEHNLSRANVVRKVQSKKSKDDRSIDRLDRIVSMAEEGYSSRQIAKELGHTPEWIRQLARDYDIPIPADKLTGKRRHIDPNRIVAQMVLDVAATSAGLDLVEFPALDRDQIAEWANSLRTSLRALSKFASRLEKELTQP